MNTIFFLNLLYYNVEYQICNTQYHIISIYKKVIIIAYNSNETNIIQTCLRDNYMGRWERVANVGWVNVCRGKCWETVIYEASDLLYCLKVSF